MSRFPIPKTPDRGIGAEKDSIYGLVARYVSDLYPEEGNYVLDDRPPWDISATGDVAIEIRGAGPTVQSPVQFIFPIGNLVAAERYLKGNSEIAWDYQTPYPVCMNFTHRSVWLIVSPHHLFADESWYLLYARAKGWPSFDVMRLMD